jgi:hypothetical protein
MTTVRTHGAARLLRLGLVLLAAVAACLAGPASSLASRPAAVTRGLDYLHAAQGSSGQFQDAGTTPWAIIAIAASGENPDGAAWRRGGKSPVDYVQSLDLASYATQSSTGNAAAYYAKMILAYVAAGRRSQITAAGAGKVDLVDKLLGFQRGDGRFCPAPSAPSIAAVNTTTWAIIALCAAQTDQNAVRDAVAWLRAQQLSDGGFSSNAKGATAGLPSDVDDTSAAIEALVAGGVSGSSDVLKNARAYLRGAQRSDGGFSSAAAGQSTYSESTAWAMQAVLALGEDPASSAWARNGRTPEAALTALQTASGAFQHKAGTLALPIVSTTQALIALSGKSFASFPRGSARWVAPFAAAPRITGFSPGAGATVHAARVTVRVSYNDPAGGTGIATSGVKIVVDGRDKTGEANVGASSLSLLLAHPTTGRHTITVTVRDRAGNVRRVTRDFTLAAGQASGTAAAAATGAAGAAAATAGAGTGTGGGGAGAATSAAPSGAATATPAQGGSPGAAATATPTQGGSPGGAVAAPGDATSSALPAAATPAPQAQSTAAPTGPPGAAPERPDRSPLVFTGAALIVLATGFALAARSHRRMQQATQGLRLTAPPDRRF